MNKVPKFRFPEFRGEWNHKKSNEIIERVTRKNKGNISNLPLTISAQYGLIDQEKFFNKTVASKNLESYYLLENGEFAYNKSYSNGYPWGAIKRLDKYNMGVLSSLYICFKEKKGINSDYLTHYFETTKWYKEISMVAVEGARNHGLLNISVSDFFDTLHYIPCYEEQQKIAKFFSLIDKKIEKQQEKVEALKDYKKGTMQKIFSQEIRFKGDNGEEYPEWEEKRLGDIAEVITDYVAAGSFESIRNNVTYYDVPNFAQLVRTTDLKNQFNNTGFVFIDENAFNFLYRVNLDKEVIVLPNIGANIGESYFINPLLLPNKNNVLGPNAILLYSNINYTKYVYYLLNTRSFHIQLREMVGASGQPKFNKTELKQMKFSIPSFEEQKKICTLLTLVDQRLEKEQEKLNYLNQWKKGLLQQMFV
ncbi:restriction endonuclease subunit S [Clostridium botulinum]|uniref:restriction endonuclease subunit S n=1 Tax=Clostridium botulinum TaxID=1491 RepID=UPI001967CC77|nr:restriction endonuclease subunit S [Clostridium botulinum]MBN1043777.1 restriction endonuclease subunit S [Clostridium botulinum]